jgi:hypothetical protein
MPSRILIWKHPSGVGICTYMLYCVHLGRSAASLNFSNIGIYLTCYNSTSFTRCSYFFLSSSFNRTAPFDKWRTVGAWDAANVFSVRKNQRLITDREKRKHIREKCTIQCWSAWSTHSGKCNAREKSSLRNDTELLNLRIRQVAVHESSYIKLKQDIRGMGKHVSFIRLSDRAMVSYN